MQQIPPLHWLQAFEAVARLLSFTNAAAELGLTQSAVSQRIKLLEDRLGEPLFHRHGRRVSLTEAANRFFPTVHESFSRLARSTAMFSSEQEHSAISVSSNISFWLNWLLPRSQDFLAVNPGCNLQITTTRWTTDPRRAGTDIEILYGGGNWNLSSTRLTRTVTFPVCAPQIAEQIRSPADLQKQFRIVTLGEETLWDEWSTGAGVALDQLRTLYTVDLQLAGLELARQGKGLALTNGVLALDLLATGELCLPVPFCIPSRYDYYVVARSPANFTSDHFAFIKWISDALGTEHHMLNQHFSNGVPPDVEGCSD